MRYNVLSNGFICTVHSAEEGVPGYLFDIAVRIRNHDLPLWEAREICINLDKAGTLVYYKDYQKFVDKLTVPELQSEPQRAWKPRVNKYQDNRYEETHQHTPRTIY